MMTNYTSIKSQQGAALVVGLVVLLVMTLLGVSSMSSIRSELKMSNNLQTHNTGFQVAASAIQAALDITSPVDTGRGGIQVFDYTALDGTSTSRVTITYSDCQLVPEGYGLTGDIPPKGLIHDFNSMAQVINAGGQVIGTVTHVTGIQTIRPGCPTGETPQ